MWGFGTHLCPGRELAKLDMLLFLLEAVLAKFDYELVEGQPTNGPKGRLRGILTANAAA